MPDFPFTLVDHNTHFRQVMVTGKTSQVSAMHLPPRETAMVGSPSDEHYILTAGSLKQGTSNELKAPSILSIDGGTTERLEAGEDGAKLVRIGDIQADPGSYAPDRQTANAQVLERVQAKDYSIADRKAAVADGSAMKDGTLVVKNGHDLQTAADAMHYHDDPVKAKAHLKGRAKTLGLPLPYGLRDTDSDGM